MYSMIWALLAFCLVAPSAYGRCVLGRPDSDIQLTFHNKSPKEMAIVINRFTGTEKEGFTIKDNDGFLTSHLLYKVMSGGEQIEKDRNSKAWRINLRRLYSFLQDNKQVAIAELEKRQVANASDKLDPSVANIPGVKDAINKAGLGQAQYDKIFNTIKSLAFNLKPVTNKELNEFRQIDGDLAKLFEYDYVYTGNIKDRKYPKHFKTDNLPSALQDDFIDFSAGCPDQPKTNVSINGVVPLESSAATVGNEAYDGVPSGSAAAAAPEKN